MFRSLLRYPIGEHHFKGANAGCPDGHVDWDTQDEWHSADLDHRWRELDATFKGRFKLYHA